MSTQSVKTPLLEFDNLQVAQGRRVLLSGMSWQMAPGDLVAVGGPSGSGKTTLLRTVAGLIGRGRGVLLGGRSPADLGWPDFRRRVLLVAQQPVLLAGSVADNLQRPFAYAHVEGAYRADRARQLLDQVHLGDVALETPARELSVGQQQRVCLVRALLLEPQVMLLDEPTSALDEKATAGVESLITTAARDTGLAALIVTHDRRSAERWCHRMIDLADYMGEAVS